MPSVVAYLGRLGWAVKPSARPLPQEPLQLAGRDPPAGPVAQHNAAMLLSTRPAPDRLDPHPQLLCHVLARQPRPGRVLALADRLCTGWSRTIAGARPRSIERVAGSSGAWMRQCRQDAKACVLRLNVSREPFSRSSVTVSPATPTTLTHCLSPLGTRKTPSIRKSVPVSSAALVRTTAA